MEDALSQLFRYLHFLKTRSRSHFPIFVSTNVYETFFASRNQGKENEALEDSTTTTSWSSPDCCVSHMTKPAPQQKRRWLRYEDDRVDFLN